MKKSIIPSTEGNKYVQVKNEGELHKLGTESLFNNSNESGGNRKSGIFSRLFTTVVVEKELQILKNSLPHRSSSYFLKLYMLLKIINSLKDSSTNQKACQK